MAQWNILELEKPISELDRQIDQIKKLSVEQGTDYSEDVNNLISQRDELLKKVFSHLSDWDRVLLARHPKRPYTMDYVSTVFDDYVELHGDRLYAEDNSMVAGVGSVDGIQVAFVGHQKGRNLKDRQFRNFGSSKPEGYRKAMRIMKLAERFHRPVICFVDTPAADCTVGSEARGISEAIARNMMDMCSLTCPVISVIIGEGGSGGAIGIAVANRVLMMENSIYSVIPPEGCASILWRDKTKAPEAAEALKITAEDALSLGIIEEIIKEPLGGAHRDIGLASANLKKALLSHLSQLSDMSGKALADDRFARFRKMGRFEVK